MLLEQGLKGHGIEYLRKRSHGTLETDENQLDALKAGQIILAYYLEEPHKSKRSSDKIFGEYYSDIFNKSISPSDIAKAFKIYKKIAHVKDMIAEELRIQRLRPVENDFLLYGAYHVFFLVGYMTDQRELSDNEIEKEINKAVRTIAKVLRKAGNPAYYSFFRDHRSTIRLVSECSQLELPLDV